MVDDKVVILNIIRLDYCKILVIFKVNDMFDNSGKVDYGKDSVYIYNMLA